MLLKAARSGLPQPVSAALDLQKQTGSLPDLEDLHQALVCATRNANTECVRLLLTVSGVNPDFRDACGNSLVYLAVKANCPEIARLLCTKGASVNSFGSGNCCPVHVAARDGLDDCLETLLLYKCDLNARDSAGSTALILAVRHKRYVPISLLLEHGCDVSACDHQGRTALHYGCQTAIAVDKLVSAGADVNAQDNDGGTPLLMAATEGLDGVVRRLCEQPELDVNLPNKTAGKTPLHILAQKGHIKSVQQLIQAGADVNVLDYEGRSPIYTSVVRAKSDVIALLLRANCRVDSFQCPSTIISETCPANLAAEQSLTTVLKLFILSGYDRGHVIQILARQQIQDLFAEEMIHHWLEHASSVPSLSQLSRRTVRHHLDLRLFANLSQLKLPDKITQYIMMSELDEVLKS